MRNPFSRALYALNRMPPIWPAPSLALSRRDPLARLGIVALLALVAASATLYSLILVQGARSHQDLDTYLSAARDLAQGRPLYQAFLQHHFPDPTLRPAYIYPPVFSLLALALSALPAPAQGWAWLIAMQVLVAVAFAFVLRTLRPGLSGALLAAAATLTFYPLWVDSLQGQANALVLALAAAGVVLVARGRDGGGLAIGIAAALKLTPILALTWLAFERRWRAAGLLLAGFGGATAVGALVRPMDTLTYFREVVPQLARGTAYYSNQSLSGLYQRLFTANPYTDPWLPLGGVPVAMALLAVLLLAFWALALRGHDPLQRAVAFLPVLPLLSSVTWEHHLVLLLPLIWVVVVELARRGWPLGESLAMAALLAGFDALARWHPGPAPLTPSFRGAQTADPLVLLSANALVLATLALFLLSPWLLRAR